MNELIKSIDQEKINRFKKTWPKLDKGSKLNRILLFIKMEKANKELNDSQESQLKILLFQLCESNAFNKISDVEYSIDEEQIISIKDLQFDKNTNKYLYKIPEKKIKNPSKSKTNVERHFSRSKTNKY